jgi:hypothetical protein
LFKENPYEANLQYWSEIDLRLKYLRTTSQTLIHSYATYLANIYPNPILCYSILRSIIETAAKSVSYHWAATSAYNELSHQKQLPPGLIMESKDMEDLLRSYSHLTKRDLTPLLDVIVHDTPFEEAIRKIKNAPSPKAPSSSKLLGICTFLSRQDGEVLKYIYNVACDIVHSGPSCLALNDLLEGKDEPEITRSITQYESDWHGISPLLLYSSLPLLCLQTLKYSRRLLVEYVLNASSYDFSSIMKRITSKVGGISRRIDHPFPYIQAFLNGNAAIIVDAGGEKITIYK